MKKEEKREKRSRKRKEKRQVKERKKEEKKRRRQGLKTAAVKKFAATVIIGTCIVLMVLGLINIFTSQDARSLRKSLDEASASAKGSVEESGRASSFAQGFITDMLSYSGDSTEYAKRMSIYCARGLELAAPEGACSVMSSQAVGTKTDGAFTDVDVRARVIYTEEGGKEKTAVRTETFRVPIERKGKDLAVTAKPLIVSGANDAQRIDAPEQIEGSEIPGHAAKKIKALIGNFLKAYCGNSTSALSYYVSDSYGEPCVLGGMKLSGIDQMQIEKKGAGYRAEVSFRINDKAADHEMHAFLTVKKGAQGRFYVTNIATR